MRKAGCLHFNESDLRRREFLRVGSLSLLGISLSQYLELKSGLVTASSEVVHSKARAQACILLWLEGGPSQVDTWDPKPNSGFKAISTNVSGIQVSELLPRVAKQMDKLAIVRSMHTEENNHPEASHYAVTGHRPNPAMQFPSLGSIIAKEMTPRNRVPAHVLTPGWETEKQYEDYFKAAFLGAEYNPLVTSDPSQKDFELADLSLPKSISLARIEDRRSFLNIWDHLYRQKVERAEHANMDTFREQALNMILTPAVREAFDLSKESDRIKATYGRSGFGQSLLLARRLVEAGSRFVTAAGYKFNAWDTHGNNNKNHRDELVPLLDQALSALLEDLEQRGLLESTVVLAMGEFGRTPTLNPGYGRDHWNHCWSLVLGGGGIKGGQVIGASDEKGAYVAERMVTMGDIYATIYKAFGIDWEKTYMHPIGRPMKIANSIDDMTGTPMKELI
ncbi:MAG: DUF1501 domain-containing protein [Acidimicrobiia bacterium]|nr:DUF1501 domain-containing protein [Acidimicrobiia bacterium]